MEEGGKTGHAHWPAVGGGCLCWCETYVLQNTSSQTGNSGVLATKGNFRHPSPSLSVCLHWSTSPAHVARATLPCLTPLLLLPDTPGLVYPASAYPPSCPRHPPGIPKHNTYWSCKTPALRAQGSYHRK